ncbi:MAG: hypothetical protein R3E12_19035 [Candidatus Eisenbacteria bacterium]
MLVRLSLLAAGSLILVLGVARAAAQDEDASSKSRLGELVREERQLQNLSALADSADFYLVLDLRKSALALCYRGAPIREYQARAIELGRPRRFFHRSAVSEEWYDQIWRDGKLDPRRRRLDESLGATEDSTGFDPDWVPMLPEELIPAPPRYEIDFTPNLVLEVVADSSNAGVGHGWKERMRALFSSRARLRLVLSPDDAGELYRALPEDTELAFRSGDSMAARGAR